MEALKKKGAWAESILHEEEELKEGGGSVKKQKRHSSSSSSSVTSIAMDRFCDAMKQTAESQIPVQQRNLPQNVGEFLSKCGLNDEQKKHVYLLLEMENPDIALVAAMDDEDFAILGLSKHQKNAWKLLASKVL